MAQASSPCQRPLTGFLKQEGGGYPGGQCAVGILAAQNRNSQDTTSVESLKCVEKRVYAVFIWRLP